MGNTGTSCPATIVRANGGLLFGLAVIVVRKLLFEGLLLLGNDLRALFCGVQGIGVRDRLRTLLPTDLGIVHVLSVSVLLQVFLRLRPFPIDLCISSVRAHGDDISQVLGKVDRALDIS